MNIYVGNLSRQAGENELRALFAQFGEVKSVKIIKDQFSGESRGFAFVEMTDADAGNQAIQALDSKEVENRRLKVNEAKPKNTGGAVYNSFSSPYGYKNRFEKY
jgi:RNA recognition motif-containing protein